MNQPAAPRGVSMPTVVFGLLLGAVAVAALVQETTGRTLDLEAAAPVALLAAGALLVLWALVGLLRQQSRRDEQAEHPTSTDGTEGTDSEATRRDRFDDLLEKDRP